MELCAITGITYLLLDFNRLTGIVPEKIGNITDLQYLGLSGNNLEGPIPTTLGQLKNLTTLYMYQNSLTGLIPEELSSLKSLSTLYLQNNLLTGSVPENILTLPLLTTIDLSFNPLLTGTLHHIFNSTDSMKGLRYVNLAGMKISGSLPDALFNYTTLDSLILSSNCISGSIPMSVCDSNIKTLILDGIGIGHQCKKSKLRFYGTIPPCIFSMPSLNVLHLAGNGLTGQIGELSGNCNLSELNLSNNQLTGPLPLSTQYHYFNNSFSASANRITGTLEDQYVLPGSYLSLYANRLSGRPPSSMVNAPSTERFDLLSGNLFGCPKLANDVNSYSTSCGTRNLFDFLILWLVLASIIIVTGKNIYIY